MSEGETLYKNPEFTLSSSKITDEMRFLSMGGREELGRAFAFELKFAVENGNIAILPLLNSPMAVCCKKGDSEIRYFHGQIASFSYHGAIDLLGGQNRHLYRAVLRPKLWSLTRRADCRIFQELSAVQIIQKVMEDAGLAAGDDFDLGGLQNSYDQRTYCVQYRETDFNFVHRLMEEEGIYYFFKHEKTKHVMMLCDSPSAHSTFPGFEKIRYDAPDQQPKPDHINDWVPVGEVTPGKYTLDDYDFLNSGTLLESVSQSTTFTDLAVYDYPGLYRVKEAGDKRAAIRLEEMRAGSAQASGGGPVLGIATGYKFSLLEHPRSDQNADYLVVSSTFQVESDQYQESQGKALEAAFKCDFAVIQSTVQFRPARLTPKPFVQGPQTAIVVGPEGDDDIYTDANGRVKVQFHWDRLGKEAEDKSSNSCWIRVASIWAGNGWGAVHIPRVKQEVIVDFLEGDPDQPIITGRVYNDLNKLPYTLPDNKTRSTIKSRSTTGGNDETYNELRFEDKKDSEEIYFHAEKDFNRVVENNDTLKVGFDKKDKGDQTIEIFNNQTLTVGAGNDQADDGSQTVTIYNNRTVTVKEGNEKLEVSKGNREVDVDKGNDTHKIGQGDRAVTIDAGNDTLTISQGNQTVKITAGKSQTQAGMSIELTVGGSSIKIEPAKITISSAEISISGNAKVSVAAPMIDINADALTKIQGGIVKVN